MKTSLTKPRNKTSSTKITRRLQNRRALRRFGPSTNLRAGAERTQQDEGQLTGEGPRSPPLHAVQPYQKTSTDWVGFQENRNYSRDPSRENLRRPAAKKKERNWHIANSEPEIRAAHVEAILENVSGSSHSLSQPRSGRSCAPRVCGEQPPLYPAIPPADYPTKGLARAHRCELPFGSNVGKAGGIGSAKCLSSGHWLKSSGPLLQGRMCRRHRGPAHCPGALAADCPLPQEAILRHPHSLMVVLEGRRTSDFNPSSLLETPWRA